MPRRRTVDTEPPQTEPLTKADDLTEREWEMVVANGKILGNVSLAGALHRVSTGMRPPKDQNETLQLLEASQKLQVRAHKAYTRLEQSIGGKLANAMGEYHRSITRTVSLSTLLNDPEALTRGTNGAYQHVFSAATDARGGSESDSEHGTDEPES